MKQEYKTGETVWFFHGGGSYPWKGLIKNHRVLPSGCLWRSPPEEEYFVEIAGQDSGFWLKPSRFWRNDIERANKGY